MTDREGQLEELLQSAHAIAVRRGQNTAWNRFAESCRRLNVSWVTARTYRRLPDDGSCLECGDREDPCTKCENPGSQPLTDHEKYLALRRACAVMIGVEDDKDKLLAVASKLVDLGAHNTEDGSVSLNLIRVMVDLGDTP